LDLYLALKFLHVTGAAILLGTGLGIAFFLFMADRAGNIEALATTLRHVVVADYVFTATAAILQPVSGLALVHLGGFSLGQTWIWASIVLYLVVGACWLPVLVLQARMRNLADEALRSGKKSLPPRYHRLMRIWFVLGWPAFLSVLGIFWLMVAKPA
jgi:uncharacterized membrane protein